MISLFIEGQPLPKERPRMGRKGTAYTPRKTAQFEYYIGLCARVCMGDKPPLLGDLAVYVTFHRKGKNRADLDNLCKAMDGFNGILWHDDNQIVQLHANVIYNSKSPGIELKVIPV